MQKRYLKWVKKTAFGAAILLSAGFASAQTPGVFVPWGQDGGVSKRTKSPIVDVIAASLSGHTLAITKDHRCIAWGLSGDGQADVPADLGNLNAVAAGGYHSLALTVTGEVVAWGFNRSGQCNVPAGLSNVTAIAAGGEFSAALSGGRVYAWGSNSDGQLNIPEPATHDITAIAAGGAHLIALKTDGTVAVWGSNNGGQLNVPTGLHDVKAISAGGQHCLVLKNNGTVANWGSIKKVPAGLSDVVAISAGSFVDMALKSDGSVVVWGDNASGQLNVPPLRGVTGIAAGGSVCSALTSSHLFLYPTSLVGGSEDEEMTAVFATQEGKSADSTITLQSSSAGIEVPGSVTLAAGKRVVGIPIHHHAVPNSVDASLTATLDSTADAASSRLLPFTLGKGHFRPGTVGVDSPTTFTVLVHPTPGEPINLSLSSSLGAVHVPATVTIPAGQKEAQVQVTSDPVYKKDTYAGIYAQYGTTPRRGWRLRVDETPSVVNLTPDKHRLKFYGGETITIDVTLSRAVKQATTIGLMTSDGAIGTVPTSINIPPGAQRTKFNVTTSAVSSLQGLDVKAQIGTGPVASQHLEILPPGVIDHMEMTLPLYGNQESKVGLYLVVPLVSGSVDFTVQTDSSITGPASVTIPAGSGSVPFNVQTKDVDHLTISPVKVKGPSGEVTIFARIRPCFVESVTLPKSELGAGESCTGTVTLTNVVCVDTPVKISIGRPLLASVPATVTVPAGSSSATFTVTANSFPKTLSTQILATRHGKNKTAGLTVHP